VSNDVWVALIGAVVPFLLLVLGVVLVVIHRKDLGRLVRGASRIKVGLVEVEVAAELLATRGRRRISRVVAERLARRAAFLADELAGRRIVWVDDQPLWNAAERTFLRTAGLVVTNATDTDGALADLGLDDVDLVITDIDRPEGSAAGVELAARMRERGYDQPIVGYIGHVDRARPLPRHFAALTDTPDELITAVLDILDLAAEDVHAD
jgi:CheY-like chemotaxis protein